MITHQVFHPALVSRVPHAVVLVELADEGVRVYGNFLGAVELLHEGLAVRAVLHDSGGRVIVDWEPDDLPQEADDG